MNINELKFLLRTLEVAPLKRYGQNFMIDDQFVNQIVDCVNQEPSNLPIIEIGPGLGALTIQLVKLNQVHAIEIDRKFSQYLESLSLLNLTVLQNNILKYDFTFQCRVVSNLPYYISTEVVEHLINHSDSIQVAYLLAQREFVDKLFGKPGQETYGPLSVLIAWVGEVHRLFDVPYHSFYPQPGVVSTFFKVHFHQKNTRETNYKFFLFIKKIFNNRRKTILNNLEHVAGDRLAADDILSKLNINPQLRPDDLTPKQFFDVFSLL
jgi:16S rRNA (adenine1518-N6/adenine1519-N6)-dimethyltransferase